MHPNEPAVRDLSPPQRNITRNCHDNLRFPPTNITAKLVLLACLSGYSTPALPRGHNLGTRFWDVGQINHSVPVLFPGIIEI